MRVLLIEDHKPLVRALRQGLEEEGFAVDTAFDGEEGDFKARSAEYDAVILDLMLPKMDGLTLLQHWRRDGLTTHVLVLTARGGIDDKVRGLDLGADDYLTKPFELEELFARLRALIRRGHQVKDPVLRIHDLEIDTAGRTVKRGGHSDSSDAARVRPAGVSGLSPRQGGFPDHDLGPPLRRTRREHVERRGCLHSLLAQ